MSTQHRHLNTATHLLHLAQDHVALAVHGVVSRAPHVIATYDADERLVAAPWRCTYAVYGCADSRADNFASRASADDGRCVRVGCKAQDALNYDSTAAVESAAPTAARLTSTCTFVPTRASATRA